MEQFALPLFTFLLGWMLARAGQGLHVRDLDYRVREIEKVLDSNKGGPLNGPS